jgi:hypothetical protein
MASSNTFPKAQIFQPRKSEHHKVTNNKATKQGPSTLQARTVEIKEKLTSREMFGQNEASRV